MSSAADPDGDSPAAFIRRLHLAPHRSLTSAETIDWTLAPKFLPQRLGATVIALPRALPPWAPAPDDRSVFALFGDWLASSAMVHRVQLGVGKTAADRPSPPSARRVLPSGGAAHPVDQYFRFGPRWADIATPLADHSWIYLPQFHALCAHRRTERLAGHATVEANVVTVMSRTAFKYRAFAYRLSAVDTGVAIGRLVGQAAAFAARIRAGPALDDEALALLVPEEKLAARFIVEPRPVGWVPCADANPRPHPHSASAVRCRVDVGDDVRRRAISSGQPDMLVRMSALSRSADGGRMRGADPPDDPFAPQYRLAVPRDPAAPSATADVIHRRRSDAVHYDGRGCDAAALGTCLYAGGRMLATLADLLPGKRRLWLCCTPISVSGVPPCTAVFDDRRADLGIIAQGPFAAVLNEAMLLQMIDMRLCAFVVHVVADLAGYDDLEGYRRAQAASGAALDAMTLAAGGHGLSAHAFLGFSAPAVGAIYGLDPHGDVQPVAQLCVGHVSDRWALETTVVG